MSTVLVLSRVNFTFNITPRIRQTKRNDRQDHSIHPPRTRHTFVIFSEEMRPVSQDTVIFGARNVIRKFVKLFSLDVPLNRENN